MLACVTASSTPSPTPHALEVMVNLQRNTMPATRRCSQIPLVDRRYLRGHYGPKRGVAPEPFKTLRPGILWSGGSEFFCHPAAARYGLGPQQLAKLPKAYGPHPFGMRAAHSHRLRSYTAWGSRRCS
jgi:hypothetical protein